MAVVLGAGGIIISKRLPLRVVNVFPKGGAAFVSWSRQCELPPNASTDRLNETSPEVFDLASGHNLPSVNCFEVKVNYCACRTQTNTLGLGLEQLSKGHYSLGRGLSQNNCRLAYRLG